MLEMLCVGKNDHCTGRIAVHPNWVSLAADSGGKLPLTLTLTKTFASPPRVHFASRNYRCCPRKRKRVAASTVCIRVLSHNRLLRDGGLAARGPVPFVGARARWRNATPKQVDADLWSDFLKDEAKISGLVATSRDGPGGKKKVGATGLPARLRHFELGRASEVGKGQAIASGAESSVSETRRWKTSRLR